MTSLERHTKRMYDLFGREYQRTREERKPERLYNELLEVPCMLKTVGAVKGKRLLDIGCGAGVHAARYAQKGARVCGIDISTSMIELARERLPELDFRVGSIMRLPYAANSFDIATASLVLNYVDDLPKAFAEVNRVLKHNGKFLFSTGSPLSSARERYEDKDIKAKVVGYIFKKKGSRKIGLGHAWKDQREEYEMVPGMLLKGHVRTFRTYLNAIVHAGFELVDFIDCKPVPAFKRYDPEAYDIYTKFPLFSIYVCRKK